MAKARCPKGNTRFPAKIGQCFKKDGSNIARKEEVDALKAELKKLEAEERASRKEKAMKKLPNVIKALGEKQEKAKPKAPTPKAPTPKPKLNKKATGRLPSRSIGYMYDTLERFLNSINPLDNKYPAEKVLNRAFLFSYLRKNPPKSDDLIVETRNFRKEVEKYLETVPNWERMTPLQAVEAYAKHINK